MNVHIMCITIRLVLLIRTQLIFVICTLEFLCIHKMMYKMCIFTDWRPNLFPKKHVCVIMYVFITSLLFNFPR